MSTKRYILVGRNYLKNTENGDVVYDHEKWFVYDIDTGGFWGFRTQEKAKKKLNSLEGSCTDI